MQDESKNMKIPPLVERKRRTKARRHINKPLKYIPPSLVKVSWNEHREDSR